jgi:transposase
MKLHGNAHTCPKSRRLLVDRLEGEWSLTEAAEAAGVSERTAAKWLARWRTGGRPARLTAVLRQRQGRHSCPATESKRSRRCDAADDRG